MATGSEEHAHEHELVEIIDSEAITAFEQSHHGIITLQLHERGLSLDLTHEEVVALGTVMEKVMEYVTRKGRQ